jgi:hypothetical protein
MMESQLEQENKALKAGLEVAVAIGQSYKIIAEYYLERFPYDCSPEIRMILNRTSRLQIRVKEILTNGTLST